MKKRLAVLFASLSLCACGFIGCDSDDSNGDKDKTEQAKVENGKDCKADNDCKSEFCQKDGDKSVCADKIADNGVCKNESDKCKSDGFSCKKADGEDDFKCIKSEGGERGEGGEGQGGEGGEGQGGEGQGGEGGEGQGGEGSEGQGGEGGEGQGGEGGEGQGGEGSEGQGGNGDDLDVDGFLKKLCEHKKECGVDNPGFDDQCNVLGPTCVDETKAYYQCQIDAPECAAMTTGCMDQMTAYSTCSSAALNDPNAAHGTKDDSDAISKLFTQVCGKNVECGVPGYTQEMCHPASDKCIDESKAYYKCQINAECSAFADAASLCKTELDAYTACTTK